MSMPQLPFSGVVEIVINSEVDNIVTCQNLTTILQTSLNLMELAKTLKNQTRSSAMLNQRMILFMPTVSCLFETSVNVTDDDTEEHHKRLLDTISSWGFKLLPVNGDGNCCFSAFACSILFQQKEILTRDLTLYNDLNLEVNSTPNEVACKLRSIAVDEWSNNPEEYQGFLDNGFSVQEEAVNFKQQGYFFGPLGNTMVLAVLNALGLPVIIFSSAHHYPLIYITPEIVKFLSHYSLHLIRHILGIQK